MNDKKVFPVPPLSWLQVAKSAETFMVSSFPSGISSPTSYPVAEILESGFIRNVFGFEYGIDQIQVEAITDFSSKTIILSEETYLSLQEDDPRARFTVAHEFGHVALHSSYLFHMESSDRKAIKLCREEIPPYLNPESQANTFAAALLMPNRHVRNLIFAGGSVQDIVTTFNVSWTAANKRYGNVNKF